MDAFERAVNETVHSGIEPFQQKFVGVFDGYTECPIAYFAKTSLFTAETGSVVDFNRLTDFREVGVRLTLRALAHAVRVVLALGDKDRTTKWVGVDISPALLLEEDVYALVADVLTREKCDDAKKICCVLPPVVLGEERMRYQKGLEDLKALGMTIAVSPIGIDFAPSTLMGAPIDFVVLNAEMTALATDRNKPGILAAFVGLIHTIGVSVIASGVNSDEIIRQLTVIECFGFVPTLDYTGEFLLPLGERSFEEIQKDEEGV